MSETALTLEAVDAFIAKRRTRLAFPAWLEERYQSGRAERRSKRLAASTRELAVVYNVFLGADLLLARDTLALSAVLHALVTASMLVALRLFSRSSGLAVRETAAAALPALMTAQILVIFMVSRAPDATHFQYLVLIPILFGNVVQRLPHRSAVAISLGAVAAHAACVFLRPGMPPEVAALASAMVGASAYVTLVANRLLERDERRNFLSTLRDRLVHERTRVEATTDALTGLANRHLLREKLEDVWAGKQDCAQTAAIVMLDLDHFKTFNDRYGHPAGDECLRRVTACALAQLRDNRDLAARYGGEELLLVLPGADLPTAIALAERIRRSIETLAIPHERFDATGVVTASFGVAAAPIDSISAEQLVAAADAALYAAKTSGRNRVVPPPVRPAAQEARAQAALRLGVRQA